MRGWNWGLKGGRQKWGGGEVKGRIGFEEEGSV